jgi:hypothetical protein
MDNTSEVTVPINYFGGTFHKIMYFRITPALNASAIISNCICALIFWRIIRNEDQRQRSGQMFKYFLCASLVETILFMFIIADIKYRCGNCGGTLAWEIYGKYFYRFFYYILVTLSNYFEVAATLDCYLMINNKMKALQTTKSFFIIFTFIIVFNFVIHIVYLFNDKIVRVARKEDDYIYKIVDSDYVKTSVAKTFLTILAIYREILPLILAFILNILVLMTLKKVMRKKKRILRQSNNNDTTTSDAEINKLRMILAVSVNYLILRFPMCLFIFGSTIFYSNDIIWKYMLSIGWTLYVLSYFLKIFIYYFFNRKFQQFFNSTIRLR